MVGRVRGGRPEAGLSVRRLPFPVRRMPLFEGNKATLAVLDWKGA
jgi:hypothetical protein